jgi:hypothetical protein
MTTEAEEIRAELNMRRGLRAEVVETLAKFDKSIADLEKQLAEAEKPKLRHGDYGVSCNGSLFFVQGETVFWLNAGGVASSISPERFGTAGRLGNLIDEIKALGEERTEWKLDREGLGVSLREGSHITHPVWISGKYLTLSEAESLSLALRQIIATAKRRPPMPNTHPDIERIGVPVEPEERFVCPNCDLDDFPEVTTECGCRVCKQCAIVCDDCGSIWCANCTFPKGELKLCRPCFDEREAAEEAAEADVAA